jgi:hypothetical protein
VLSLVLTALLLQAPGRPLYYWGARPATLVTSTEGREGTEARVVEVHGVVDDGELVLEVTFDRPVRDALYLPSGAPVSGRLRATLYVDGDASRETGWAAGPGDARTGADYRIDLGVLALGADPEEGIAAQPLVTVHAVALSEQGRQRTVWRGDHSATPGRVSLRGDSVEMRLPAGAVDVSPTARLVLIEGDQACEGRLRP